MDLAEGVQARAHNKSEEIAALPQPALRPSREKAATAPERSSQGRDKAITDYLPESTMVLTSSHLPPLTV